MSTLLDRAKQLVDTLTITREMVFINGLAGEDIPTDTDKLVVFLNFEDPINAIITDL